MSSSAAASSEPDRLTDPPSPEALAAAAITAQLTAETVEGACTKRKQGGGDDDSEGASESFKDYGRAFLRLGDPFTPVDTIVQHGIFVDTTEEIDYPKMDEKERETFDHLTQSWEILWRMIGPDFRERMIRLAKNRKLRRRVCAKIMEGINGSRGEDANTLKKYIINWLTVDPTVALDPPLQPGVKINRGWSHGVTARLLCPAKRLPNDATYEAIVNGDITVTGNNFPRFLYPDDWVYEQHHLMDQIFEGHLLPRVAKCILQGPATALKVAGAHRGNRGNAARIGARVINARLMGYFAFQARFALSGLESWQQVDGVFDYEQFYWTIVKLFDDGDNTDILKRFNHEVFGDVAGRPINDVLAATGGAAEEEESDLEAYRVQRAAKRARLAAAAAAAELPGPSTADLVGPAPV
ncbi:hypothetical protein C8R44DRAFT_738026 [Mycena epipterygia]|nr:hypothetical protein C8R44DRAFT_738026 [Mycena epipterygia]